MLTLNFNELVMNKLFILLLIGILAAVTSCNKFIEAELPETQLAADKVFADDNTATCMQYWVYMLTCWINLISASGTFHSFVALAGLSADELQFYSPNTEMNQFQVNQLRSDNGEISYLWTSLYQTIYDCNGVIEGLNKGEGLTEKVKQQLLGVKAIFVWAFCYFSHGKYFWRSPHCIKHRL